MPVLDIWEREMDVVEELCPSRCKIWITTVQLPWVNSLGPVCWHHHQYDIQWRSQEWLCLNILVCLNLTLRYMKILEVAAAICKGHLDEKYWGKANAEWGIPVKPRAESEIRSSLAIQTPIFKPSWKGEEIHCCLILSYISFPWSLTPVTSFWWGKKLKLVTLVTRLSSLWTTAWDCRPFTRTWQDG